MPHPAGCGTIKAESLTINNVGNFRQLSTHTDGIDQPPLPTSPRSPAGIFVTIAEPPSSRTISQVARYHSSSSMQGFLDGSCYPNKQQTGHPKIRTSPVINPAFVAASERDTHAHHSSVLERLSIASHGTAVPSRHLTLRRYPDCSDGSAKTSCSVIVLHKPPRTLTFRSADMQWWQRRRITAGRDWEAAWATYPAWHTSESPSGHFETAQHRQSVSCAILLTCHDAHFNCHIHTRQEPVPLIHCQLVDQLPVLATSLHVESTLP
jgi:hypothetical protein